MESRPNLKGVQIAGVFGVIDMDPPINHKGNSARATAHRGEPSRPAAAIAHCS